MNLNTIANIISFNYVLQLKTTVNYIINRVKKQLYYDLPQFKMTVFNILYILNMLYFIPVMAMFFFTIL